MPVKKGKPEVKIIVISEPPQELYQKWLSFLGESLNFQKRSQINNQNVEDKSDEKETIKGASPKNPQKP